MKKVLPLILFGIAFGFLEAAVVVYLRKLFGYEAGFNPGGYKVLLNLGIISFISPAESLIPNSFIVGIERLREVSTIIMLISISYLAGKNLRERLGAFLMAFSLWDIFYPPSQKTSSVSSWMNAKSFPLRRILLRRSVRRRYHWR